MDNKLYFYEDPEGIKYGLVKLNMGHIVDENLRYFSIVFQFTENGKLDANAGHWNHILVTMDDEAIKDMRYIEFNDMSEFFA